jgi:hypothetical protein
MRCFFLLMITAAIAACIPAAEMPKAPAVSFDSTGRTKGEIPALKIGDTFYFDLPSDVTLTYQFSDEIGSGKVLPTCLQVDSYNPGMPIIVPASISRRRTGTNGSFFEESRSVRVLYFNLKGKAKPADGDTAKLADLKGQLVYYSALYRPVSWDQRKRFQDQIAEGTDQISQLQDEIKAYTGMSLPAAVTAIEGRQQTIRELHSQIRDLQKQIDGSGLQEQVDTLQKQISELTAKINSDAASNAVLLRAGVLVIGEERKPVYYTLNSTGDASSPWLLKRFQKFPVFTTNDIPYVVVLGQRSSQDPQALRASFTSKAGTYIDTDPVRPVVTQVTTPSKGFVAVKGAESCETPDPPTYAYVDRVLQFTDRLSGETIYSVTVSGYGLATTTDSVTVIKGTTPSNQQQTVMARTTLKPLDGDAWPQVHSLYRYNLSTGVVWSTIRTPTFSRVATGNYLPVGCDPTTSVATTGATSSSTSGTTTTTTSTTTSTTTGTTTTNSPSTTATTTCLATYQTQQVSGGPRVLPVLMFTFYPIKRDTQIKTVQWKEVLPAPAIGLSLTSPSDDFFLGGSSELKPFRNLQLVYGLHLGRVTKLGSNGFQNPFDSTAPQTTYSLHTGAFVGLNFNIDFVKGIFKP